MTFDAIKSQPSLAKFQFRATNKWIDGAHNRSTIKNFYGAGQEDQSREKPFVVDIGEPAVLLGTDTGPNPAEFLLHAIAGCLTVAIVNVATARGVTLTRVESSIEGDIDVLGTLGLDDSVRNGFEGIRINFQVEGDAPAEKLQEIVDRAKARSAVFDSVTRGVPIAVGLAG